MKKNYYQTKAKLLRYIFNKRINDHLKSAYVLVFSKYSNNIVILYPLINYSSTLQIKCSLLIYTSIIRPLITYTCPVWAVVS
jgi:hypothetical protein